jgi:hypothetical protein
MVPRVVFVLAASSRQIVAARVIEPSGAKGAMAAHDVVTSARECSVVSMPSSPPNHWKAGACTD